MLVRPLRAASARVLAGLVGACLLWSGCVPLGPPTGEPTADSSGDFTRPLPTLPIDVRLLGATGDALWIDSAGRPPAQTQVSVDGGATWQDGPLDVWVGLTAAGAGSFGNYGTADELASPSTFRPLDQEGTDLPWDDEELRLDALGSQMALATNGRLASAKRTVRIAFPKLPPSAKKPKHSYQFSADSGYVVRVSRPAGSSVDFAGVVDTATGKAAGLVRLPRSGYHLVGGSSLYSLVVNKTGLSVCRQPLPAGAPRCDVVAPGDHSGSKAVLYQSGGISLVKDPAGPALMLEDGTVSQVALPSGAESWRLDGPGDPTRPLIRVLFPTGNIQHLRVAADGNVSEYLTLQRGALRPSSMALTPATLLGTGLQASLRTDVLAMPLGGADHNPIGYRADWVHTASAGRWVLGVDFKPTLFDAQLQVRRLGFAPRVLSGPYALAWSSRVYQVTGKKLVTSRATALFGSLVAEDLSRRGKPEHVLRVRSLADDGFKPVTFKLAGTSELYTFDKMWGDWIGTTVAVDISAGDFTVVLHNFLTGARLEHDGSLEYLGDGFAVLSRRNAELGEELFIWVMATGEEIPLGEGTSSLTFAADGARVAYATATDLVLRTVDGVGTSAPRLLGALTSGKATTASPLRMEIDVTKPVVAGALVIRNRAGTVVRTVATAASDTGSLRGLSWDGRNEAGQRVAKGAYTWQLVAEAADGSGLAVSVIGTGPAGGLIQVG